MWQVVKIKGTQHSACQYLIWKRTSLLKNMTHFVVG